MRSLSVLVGAEVRSVSKWDAMACVSAREYWDRIARIESVSMGRVGVDEVVMRDVRVSSCWAVTGWGSDLVDYDERTDQF